MAEFLLLALGLTVVILAWGKISKSLDWAGNKIDQTSDIIDDVILSGTKQTARGVILSDDTLQESILDSMKKKAKIEKEKAKFRKDLDTTASKAVTEHEKWLAKYANR